MFSHRATFAFVKQAWASLTSINVYFVQSQYGQDNKDINPCRRMGHSTCSNNNNNDQHSTPDTTNMHLTNPRI